MNTTNKADALHFTDNFLEPHPIEHYIKQHQDHIVITKLKHNTPLTQNDVKILEGLVWKTDAVKELYTSIYGDKPLGEFVRNIVGLYVNVVKEKFSCFLDNASLNSKQIYFINQIINYLANNGIMTDYLEVTNFPYLNDITELFTDSFKWAEIRTIIEKINTNAKT